MRITRSTPLVGGALAGGLCMLATADVTPSPAELAAQVAELRAEVAQLKAQRGEHWLNERRAQEVKSLVREVLADAGMRASLQGGGVTAGHDGKNFFLASDDGSFLMTLDGQIQVRHVANFRHGSDDDLVSGFQLRRTQLSFSGHVGSPKIEYEVTLAAERDADVDDGLSDGDVYAEVVKVEYEIIDGLSVHAGKFRQPFLREETTSSSRQLAVERSSVNQYFTLNRGEGVMVTLDSPMVRVAAMMHDGANSENTDFHADMVDLAVVGRVDVKLAGQWGQMRDFSAWRGEPLGVFVGAAVDYEIAETGSAAANDKLLLWTIDGSVEFEGFNAFASFTGLHADYEAGGDADDYGLVIQGGYMVIPDTFEPFARYEMLTLDGAADVSILTMGANYYLKKHNAKFTLDVVWVMDPLTVGGGNRYSGQGNPRSSGLGLLSSSEDDMVALRSQFQLLF